MESGSSEDSRNIVSANVPVELADRIEAQRETGESRSAAVRRILRSGLDVEEQSDFRRATKIAYHWSITITIVAAIGTLALLFLQLLAFAPYPPSATLAVSITGLIYSVIFYLIDRSGLPDRLDQFIQKMEI